MNQYEEDKKRFEDSIRVDLTKLNNSSSSNSSDGDTIIETLICINDGLGFQKIKKY